MKSPSIPDQSAALRPGHADVSLRLVFYRGAVGLVPREGIEEALLPVVQAPVWPGYHMDNGR